MCLAAGECLVLICMLSSRQSSEERRCYNSLWADVEMVLWRCTAVPGTEQSLCSMISNPAIADSPSNAKVVGNREAIHLADLGLSPLPWDWSHGSCLSFILGKNPSQAVIGLSLKCNGLLLIWSCSHSDLQLQRLTLSFLCPLNTRNGCWPWQPRWTGVWSVPATGAARCCECHGAMVLASSFPLFCGDLTLAPGTLPSALLAGSWPMCSYGDISLTSQGEKVMGTS